MCHGWTRILCSGIAPQPCNAHMTKHMSIKGCGNSLTLEVRGRMVVVISHSHKKYHKSLVLLSGEVWKNLTHSQHCHWWLNSLIWKSSGFLPPQQLDSAHSLCVLVESTPRVGPIPLLSTHHRLRVMFLLFLLPVLTFSMLAIHGNRSTLSSRQHESDNHKLCCGIDPCYVMLGLDMWMLQQRVTYNRFLILFVVRR